MIAVCTRGKFTNGYRGRNGGWEGASEKNLCRSMYHPGKLKNRLLLGLAIPSSLHNVNIYRHVKTVK
jgi:hypothetical protein